MLKDLSFRRCCCFILFFLFICFSNVSNFLSLWQHSIVASDAVVLCHFHDLCATSPGALLTIPKWVLFQLDWQSRRLQSKPSTKNLFLKEKGKRLPVLGVSKTKEKSKNIFFIVITYCSCCCCRCCCYLCHGYVKDFLLLW